MNERRCHVRPAAMLVACTSIALYACGRSKPRRSVAPPSPAAVAAPAEPTEPAPAESAPVAPPAAVTVQQAEVMTGVAAALDRRWGLESPRSTSTLRPKWPPPRHRGVSAAVVYLGRSHLTAGGRRLLAMKCTRGRRPCRGGEAHGPVGRTLLAIAAADLTPPARGLPAGHGTVRALAARAGPWRDMDVLVLADRRVGWLAIHQVLGTLAEAGARARLAAVDVTGTVVELNHERPLDGQAAWASRPARPPARAGGGIPADLRTVEVQVGRRASEMVLMAASGAPRRLRVDPARPSVVGAQARRVLSAHPGLRGVSLIIDQDASWNAVVALVDALRDDCASRPGKGRCQRPVRLFARIELSWTGDWQTAPAEATSAPTVDSPAEQPHTVSQPTAVPRLHMAPANRGTPPTRIAPTMRLDRPGMLGLPQPGSGARLPGVAH